MVRVNEDALAIHGGQPINTKQLVWDHDSIGEEERDAVLEVLDSKMLSEFQGVHGPKFLGGSKVRELEESWSKYFEVDYAVSVNSATSGLYAAVGALGVGPGDEVVVPPYTMSATAAAVLGYNAIPIFADIEEDYFCLDPVKIEEKISDKTRAIIAVNLFGQPADLDAIMNLAKKYNLKVIEDNAQSPGARHKGRYAGTVADIGVFSLNYHKHIQSGEGGIIVTNDEELATRVRLIRNHAEAVVGDMGYQNPVSMLGWNYRMTEIEAAIARVQLQKLATLNQRTIELSNYLTQKLKPFDFLQPPQTRPGALHVYYLYIIKYDAQKTGVHRDVFLRALNGEGYKARSYNFPVHLLPLFEDKNLYGDKGCPFSCPFYGQEVRYGKGLCPVTERLEFEEVFFPGLIRSRIEEKDIDIFADAVAKVYSHLDELR